MSKNLRIIGKGGEGLRAQILGVNQSYASYPQEPIPTYTHFSPPWSKVISQMSISQRGNTGDAQLLQKFDIYLQSSKFYQSRDNNNNSKNKATSKSKGSLGSTDFSITHYAGTVKYSIINFVEKNKDVLYSSLSAVSFSSSCNVLKQCFPEGTVLYNHLKLSLQR